MATKEEREELAILAERFDLKDKKRSQDKMKPVSGYEILYRSVDYSVSSLRAFYTKLVSTEEEIVPSITELIKDDRFVVEHIVAVGRSLYSKDFCDNKVKQARANVSNYVEKKEKTDAEKALKLMIETLGKTRVQEIIDSQ